MIAAPSKDASESKSQSPTHHPEQFFPGIDAVISATSSIRIELTKHPPSSRAEGEALLLSRLGALGGRRRGELRQVRSGAGIRAHLHTHPPLLVSRLPHRIFAAADSLQLIIGRTS
jgi:hypothetical protein